MRGKWGSFARRVAVNICIVFWYSGECVQRNGCSCSASELFFKFECHCFAGSAGADCRCWGVLFLLSREEVASLIICLADRWWGFERIGQGQVALMLRPGSFRFHVLLVWIPVGLALIVDRNPMRRLILRDSRTGFRGRWGSHRDPFAWMHSLGRDLRGPHGAVPWRRPLHCGGIMVIVIML